MQQELRVPLSETESISSLSRLQVFAFLYALATLFHFEWTLEHATISQIPCSILAMLLILTPSSSRLLFLLATSNFVDFIIASPKAPNHWTLTAIVGLAIVAAFLPHLGKVLKGGFSAEQVFVSLLPVLQVSVCVFYFFTFLWKLNYDFINPEFSCATKFYSHLSQHYFFFPESPLIQQVVIYSTLAFEGLLPFLLLSRRTRKIAVCLAILFHAGLAFDFIKKFANFSSVMFCLLSLFVAAESWKGFAAKFPTIFEQYAKPVRVGIVVIYSLIILSNLAPAIFGPADLQLNYTIFRQIVWFAYATVALAFVLYLLLEKRIPDAVASSRAPIYLWLFPLIVFLNGASPLLGLKTRTSWQMYSNLRMEAEESNHMLLPRSLDLLGYLSQRVEILDSSDSYLRSHYTDRGLAITLKELRAYIPHTRDITLRYKYQGKEVFAEFESQDKLLTQPLSTVERKFLNFIPLGENASRICIW